MSERAEKLRRAIDEWIPEDLYRTDDDPTRIARAICEHLGITWEAVEVLKEMAMEEVDPSYALDMLPVARALATLLEAAGIRPEPPEES